MIGSDTTPRLSRRSLLAGAAGLSAAAAGCIGRVQTRVGRSQQTPLSVDITTLYADLDPFGIRIAQELRSKLEAVGFDAQLRLVDVRGFSEQVLLNHDFDIYVGQFPYPQPPDPDLLYPLFRSTFDGALGWQNPYGFTHLSSDQLLDSQRSTSGERRQQAVDELQELLARTQPFVPLVAPTHLSGVRTNSFEADSWNQRAPTRPHNLLKLNPTGDPGTLGLAVVDDRITGNRNPISADYKQGESLVDLLYDPLVLEENGDYIPWLAREYQWDETDDQLEVSITLREGLEWHDGEPLTAFDVYFTYEFLRDTSLGEAVRPIPSERFRGRISLVEAIHVQNSRELRIRFTNASQQVAKRALAVPILPAHIWETRTRIERPRNRSGETTVALTTANQEAVGSGPIQFDQEPGDDIVEFTRFDSHFLWRLRTQPDADDEADVDAANESVSNESTTQPNSTIAEADASESTVDDTEIPPEERFEPPPEAYDGPLPFERLTVFSVGSDTVAMELLRSGEADATIATLRPTEVGTIEADSDLDLIEHQSNAFYHLGFNTRREPLRNPNVRRLIAQVIDKSRLVEQYFDGYGRPIASPLAETEWLADSLRWDGSDPEVPFIGTDGVLDVERAREQFRDIGYQYTADNELISQIR